MSAKLHRNKPVDDLDWMSAGMPRSPGGPSNNINIPLNIGVTKQDAARRSSSTTREGYATEVGIGVFEALTEGNITERTVSDISMDFSMMNTSGPTDGTGVMNESEENVGKIGEEHGSNNINSSQNQEQSQNLSLGGLGHARSLSNEDDGHNIANSNNVATTPGPRQVNDGEAYTSMFERKKGRNI